MKLRYDFGEKLDLSKFQKQAPHYIRSMRQLVFELYVHDFRIMTDVVCFDDRTTHLVDTRFEEIKRDETGDIISCKLIDPLADTRFKEIEQIQNLFNNGCTSSFESSSVEFTTSKLCTIIKLLHKINGLKAFI